VLAEAGALAAGMVGMPLWPFIAATTIANALVAVAFAATGMAALSADSFLLVFFGLTTLPAIGWVTWRIFINRRRHFPE
jgi:membrane protein DedA with SNARE-associated domain